MFSSFVILLVTDKNRLSTNIKQIYDSVTKEQNRDTKASHLDGGIFTAGT
jgi:hypothetical protein